MSEHEWEELFVVRNGENIYSGIDRCNNCKTLRKTTPEGFRYQLAMWYSVRPIFSASPVTETEPPCEIAPTPYYLVTSRMGLMVSDDGQNWKLWRDEE